MPAYQFTAISPQGHEQKGLLEAESEKHARQLLRDRSLTPLTLKSVNEKKIKNKDGKFSFSWGTALSAKELALFTRQFATLLSAGLPVEESLQAVAEQTERAKLKSLIISVRSKVMEGHALHQAMSDHQGVFSHLYCSTIAAGEKTGHLDKVLVRLADYTEQQWHMRQKLKTASIYPAMIVLVALGIVGFLLEYVVPKMVGVYGHLSQNLPTLTQILISISDFLKKDGLYLFLAIGTIIFFVVRLIKKNVTFRKRFQQLLLRLPLVGYVLKTSNTARFSRTLSILTASGVPALEAMAISADLLNVIPMRSAITQAVQRVREGAAINLALKQTQYFTPMSIHMIASGEASGQLEQMLARVAQNQEDEILRLIEVVLALFEPAVILIMGGIVLFIVLAVMLPIFQLNDFMG